MGSPEAVDECWRDGGRRRVRAIMSKNCFVGISHIGFVGIPPKPNQPTGYVDKIAIISAWSMDDDVINLIKLTTTQFKCTVGRACNIIII